MQTSTSQIGASATSPVNYTKLREQAEELESVFLNTLMKEMFTSIKTDENSMGGGFAEDTWRSMQAEQMATAVTRAGGVGLAEALMPDLIAAQEAAQNQYTQFGEAR